MDYLIDSNSLMDAYKKWYRPEVFKSVWKFLAENKHVKMTTFVYHEIKYPDNLVSWTQDTFEQDLITPSQEIVAEYIEIMDWVTDSKYWNAAGISKWQSPDKADPWLVATAKVNQQTIVTMDGNGRVSMPDDGALSKQEPKISAVSTHFGVQTITIYELLDKLNLSL